MPITGTKGTTTQFAAVSALSSKISSEGGARDLLLLQLALFTVVLLLGRRRDVRQSAVQAFVAEDAAHAQYLRRDRVLALITAAPCSPLHGRIAGMHMANHMVNSKADAGAC